MTGYREKRRASVAVTSALLMASVTVADALVPLGLAFAVLHIPAVLITLWSPKSRDPLIAGLLCSALTVLGYFLSPSAGDEWLGLGNRALSIFAVWVTAVGCYQQKIVDSDIRERASALRAILETAVDAIVTIDRTGKVRSFNPAAERMFGYSEEEILGQDVSRIMPEPFRSEHGDYLRSYLETGEKKIIGVGREATGLRRDGSVFPLHLAVSELSDGMGFAGMLRDVTEEHRAEKELVESRRALATLIENLPGIAYRCQNDRSWTMEFVSAGSTELIGYEPADLVMNAKLAFSEIIHPGDRERVWHEVQEAVRASRPFEISYRLVAADDTVRWVWEQGRAVLGEDGEVEALEGIITDVTERRRLEEEFHQSQKQEAIGRLAGGIAHDFNNLLMGIIGCCRIVMDDLDGDAEPAAQVREIKEAAERGASLTRQLLDFSRRKVVDPEPIFIDEVVEKVDTLLRRLLGEDVALRTELRSGGGPVVADPGQIEQILLNLAVNARDAMPGGGELRVATYLTGCSDEDHVSSHASSSGRMVVLEVTDDGCGMSDDVRDRAFEPFFTTKADTEGTGLGLATVYGIVQQLGGHIHLDSEVGRGTRFLIHLPESEAPTRAVSPAAIEAMKPRSAETRTILVVEDDRLVRAGIRHLLTSQGYEVLLASHGEEALRVCDEHEGAIDLLLTDVVMPGMGGGELAGKFRERRPDTGVIVMSALPHEVLVEQGRLRDDLPTIQKPFEEDELVRRIREELEGG